MIVIADTSPLVVLVNLELIDILPRLFGKVVIPPAVFAELNSPKRPAVVRTYFATVPPWLVVRPPAMLLDFGGLDIGETQALSLAVELGADLVLIDERLAHRVATNRQIPVIGTIRVLERAAEAGLIDLKDAFARIRLTDFWISRRLLDERLKRHLAKKGRTP